MIVTGNKPFSGWGEIFGDDIVAAAMIDRLVHHAEIVALKGDSCRASPASRCGSRSWVSRHSVGQQRGARLRSRTVGGCR
jgi:hypothetical protein